MPENLWPTDFGHIGEKPPVTILREQAQALGELTSNIVRGEVSLDPEPRNEFSYVFQLFAAPLGYRTELFQARHGVELYPVRLFVDGDLQSSAASPDELKVQLKELFSRDQTKRTIASLLKQSTA